MSKIEEVKKILYKAKPAAGIIDLDITCLAKAICQLFEPKPDKNWLGDKPEYFEVNKTGTSYHNMDKPDEGRFEGRLLTNEEIHKAKETEANSGLEWKPPKSYYLICKAQDAKTASIKDAECQARVNGRQTT